MGLQKQMSEANRRLRMQMENSLIYIDERRALKKSCLPNAT